MNDEAKAPREVPRGNTLTAADWHPCWETPLRASLISGFILQASITIRYKQGVSESFRFWIGFGSNALDVFETPLQ